MGKTINKELQKLEKVSHPKARKVVQLIKKTNKTEARQKAKHVQQMKSNIIGEKFLWFRDNLKSVECYTPDLLMELIEKYHSRFNEELEQIKLKHSVGKRKGRQHASREDIIKLTLKQEQNEYNTCGIELPDILNVKQLNLLRDWSGELRLLQNFQLRRFNKSKLLSMRKERPDKEEIKRNDQNLKDDFKVVEETNKRHGDNAEQGSINMKAKGAQAEEEMDTE